MNKEERGNKDGQSAAPEEDRYEKRERQLRQQAQEVAKDEESDIIENEKRRDEGR
jgi:hypothetical protein